MNLCNDELKNQGLLECYECDQCRGKERLVTCANGTKNCFVLTGLVGCELGVGWVWVGYEVGVGWVWVECGWVWMGVGWV